MLTPSDLLNPKRKSGYDHVDVHPNPRRAKRYRARAGHTGAGPKTNNWRGTDWYATPVEAAQDYCDYVNGNGVTPAPQLKSAGHSARRRAVAADPEVQAALGVLRDAKGQEEGKQGYVYCISDGTALKVGFSTNPDARLAELQTGNPRRLYIIDRVPGTLEDEAALHAKYIKDNILQEWFAISAALMDEFRPSRKVRSAA